MHSHPNSAPTLPLPCLLFLPFPPGSPPVPAAQQALTPPPKSRAAPAPKAASATKPAAGRAGAGAKAGGAAAGGGGGAAAARKGAAAAGTQQQPLPPHLQHSYDAQQRQQQGSPAPGAGAAEGGGVDGMADDPAPFEAELRNRERQYGQSHPAVAESCSNLAILYNQRGDVSAWGGGLHLSVSVGTGLCTCGACCGSTPVLCEHYLVRLSTLSHATPPRYQH